MRDPTTVIYVTEVNKTFEPKEELMRRASKSGKLGPLVPEIRALARYSASGRSVELKAVVSRDRNR